MVAYLAKGLSDSGVCSAPSLLLLLPAGAAAAGEAGLCIAPLVPHLLGVPLLLPLGLLPAAAAAAALEPASSAAAAATGTGMMLPLGLHSSWKVTVLPTEGDVTLRTYSSSSSMGTSRLKIACCSDARVLKRTLCSHPKAKQPQHGKHCERRGSCVLCASRSAA
jgi:hypothetical protein